MAEIDLAQGSVADNRADTLVQDTHSRIWLDALLNDTVTFVLTADRDGRLLSANDSANRCFGGGRDTIIGQAYHY